jgi:hypothetical protein
MDEWMHLTGGEATHRQQAQRAMRHAARTPRPAGPGHPLRAALASLLVAVAARLDPALLSPRRERDTPLATRA